LANRLCIHTPIPIRFSEELKMYLRIRNFFKTNNLAVLIRILVIDSFLPTLAWAQLAQDPNYQGSSFNQVLDVIENQGMIPQGTTEQQEAAVYQSGQLPQYRVNFWSLGGLIFSPLLNRSKQTLVDRADYYDHFEKYVHANGVCVVGKWEIKNATPYTGFFRQGAAGLFIGRISVALQETTSAGNRGFGFAGKIFPTTNPNQVVPTTSFFTVDELSGTPAARFMDQALTNEPPLIPNFDLTGELVKIIPAFLLADSSPTFRPVTQIARINAGQAVRSPIWMRLRAAPQMIKNNQADFRNEVVQAMEDNNGRLTFIIETSSTTKDRKATVGWNPVGTMTLNRSIVSYGCDRRLHFSHPKDDKSNVTTK
jgi:hypothetical protein